MLGFSIPKIIFLFIILLIIWNVFKYIERKKHKKEVSKNNYNGKGMDSEESLIECKVCGNFYSCSFPEGCPVCEKGK